MSKPTPKGTFTVRMERTVVTLVTCTDCTEDEARDNPWDYATDEQDIDQVDWRVLRVDREDES